MRKKKCWAICWIHKAVGVAGFKISKLCAYNNNESIASIWERMRRINRNKRAQHEMLIFKNDVTKILCRFPLFIEMSLVLSLFDTWYIVDFRLWNMEMSIFIYLTTNLSTQRTQLDMWIDYYLWVLRIYYRFENEKKNTHARKWHHQLIGSLSEFYLSHDFSVIIKLIIIQNIFRHKIHF